MSRSHQREEKARKKRKRGHVGWDDELWSLRFLELKEFVAQKGHTRVPARWKPNPPLGRWLATQRNLARRGEIEPDRARKLSKLGVEWVIAETRIEKHDEYMEQMLARLAAYRAKYGHVAVAKTRDRELAQWIVSQRHARKTGRIKPYRLARLDEAAFPWEPINGRWMEKLNRLRGFRDRFGHTRVPSHWPVDTALGCWVEEIRHRGRQGRIDPDFRDELDALGFEWNLRRPAQPKDRKLPYDWKEELWNLRFAELQDFIALKGHPRVPCRWKQNPSLGSWLATQRKMARLGLIEPDRARKLQKLGVEWVIHEIHVEEHDEYMERMLARLAAYVATHGHNRVDKRIDPGLAYWIGRQRIFRNAGHLREYRRKRLDEAGFPWRHVDPGWEEKFGRLQAFRERFGHTRVARYWREDSALGRWVEHQRARHREGGIEPDQRERLEALGFEWECGEARVEEQDQHLEQMLARLRAYRERYGHVGVTRARDFALWQWIQCQKKYQAAGCLKPSRRRAMDAAGFPWERVDCRWEDNFLRLREYHRQHGHTRVPAKYAADRTLGSWVANQRNAFQQGTLPEERRQRLDAIGPEWKETEWPQVADRGLPTTTPADASGVVSRRLKAGESMPQMP